MATTVRAATGLACALALSGCGGHLFRPLPARSEPVARIAFGSCLRQGKPQPVWDALVAAEPDLTLLLGDNVYADTHDPAVLAAAYEALFAEPGFQRLRAVSPVLAIWDDHDYGWNDAGAEYPMRRESERLFLAHFDAGRRSARRRRAGIYEAHRFGRPGRRLQVLLLDGRSFRSRRGDEPTDDPAATMLGAAQWRWLEAELRRPAELRLVVSGVQVVADTVRRECWGDFPRERRRLFELVATTGAGGVVLLSGDRHFGELSRFDGGPYPLYDLTSSGMNVAIGSNSREDVRNDHRVGEPYLGDNYGTVTIDWTAPDPTVDLRIHDVTGAPRLSHRLRLSELQPAAGR